MTSAARGAVYTWSGGSGGNWSDVANWLCDGAAATSLPTTNDEVVFPESVDDAASYSVVVDTTDAVATNVMVNGTVTFSGTYPYVRNKTSGNSLIYTTAVCGSGSVVLGDNSGFGSRDVSSTLDISVPIEVTASADAPAAIQGCTSTKVGKNTVLTISGNISGDGCICFAGGRLNGQATGSMSAFSGIAEIVDDDISRNNMRFVDVGESATYCITNNTSDGASFLMFPAADYKFAELTGNPQNRIAFTSLHTYEIGSSSNDFTLGGTWFYTAATSSYNDRLASYGIVIRKTGSGTMKFSGSRVHGYEIAEGTLSLDSDAAAFSSMRSKTHASSIAFAGGILALGEDLTLDVSTNIAASTAAIDVYTDVARTWNAPLAADNEVHTINKRGYGTLEIAVPPAWEGKTTVRMYKGRLVIPADMDFSTGNKTVVSELMEGGRFMLVNTSAIVAVVGDKAFSSFAVARQASSLFDQAITLRADVANVELDPGETVRVIANGHSFSAVVPDGYELSSATDGDETVYSLSPIVYSITYLETEGVAATFADGISAPALYTAESSDFAIPSPERAGYSFVCWRDASGEEVDSVSMGTIGNIVLVAEWQIVEYTLSFANAPLSPVAFTVEDSVALPVPEKAGATFEGWYLDPSFTTKVDSIPAGTARNVTVYAMWTGDTGSNDGIVASSCAVYNMNADWEFAKKPEYVFTTDLAVTNELEWSAVSLPHSINAHDTFNGHASDGGGTGWRGLSYYRKRFKLDDVDVSTCKYILEFETVRQAIYVWVNGKPVGYYEGGIVSSGFDLGDYIVPGENEVVVCLDSTSRRNMTGYFTETVPGTEWGSHTGVHYVWNTNDFNPTEGGITGSVRLHVKPKAYLTLPLYNNLKTRGVYVTADDFDFATGTATIRVEAEVRNETGASAGLGVSVSVTDAATGSQIAAFSSPVSEVAAASDAGTNWVTAVENDVYVYDAATDSYLENSNAAPTAVTGPESSVISASSSLSGLVFWSPGTPHLYDVSVTLFRTNSAGETVCIDREKVTTGFRKVEFDHDGGGLSINGKSVWLTGYAQRSTDEWAAIGIPPQWMQDFDAALIRESGANFIRWMHIAAKPAMARAFDKYGVVNVCPAGDKEGDREGRQWTQRTEAMRDVLIYFRNSPSILFWEAGNQAVSPAHMREMTSLKRILDPDGGRLMGCRSLQSESAIAEAEWVGTMLHRHGSIAQNSMASIGEYKPIIETEYAREESPRRAWDDYTPPDYDYVCDWTGGGEIVGKDTFDMTQEDFILQNFNVSDGYAYYYGNRVGGRLDCTYSGCAALCWSDSIQHGRNTASENARMSGRVDPVRIPKPSFYAYQAAQSDVPKVRIIGHWSYPGIGPTTYVTADGTIRDPAHKTVWVAGSAHCASVELFINGDSVGVCTEPEEVFLYRFDDIDVTQSGRVSARAYDKDGNVIASDSIVSAGDPSALDCTVRTGPDGFLADGSDIAMVDIKLVDGDGVLIPYGTQKLEFSLEFSSTALQPSHPTDQPTFMGGYNSGTFGDESPIGQNWVNLEAGQNRVFIRAGREAGTAMLVVSCPELELERMVALELTPVAVTNGLMKAGLQTMPANAVDYTPSVEAERVQDLGANAIAPTYEVLVNDSPVEFALPEEVVKPDSLTGVVCPVARVLQKMIDEGLGGMSYECGVDESQRPYIAIASGTNELTCALGDTEIFVNGTSDLTNWEFVLDSNGEIVGEIAAIIPYIDGAAVVTEEANRKVAIEVVTAPRTCWWAGGDGYGVWHESANWRDANGCETRAPRSTDTAIITNEVTFAAAEGINVSVVTNSRPLTFSGGQTVAVSAFYGLGDEASVRLASVNLVGPSETGLTFDEAVEVVGGTTNGVKCISSGYPISFKRDFSGSGTLCADQEGGVNSFVVFSGNASGFSGRFAVVNPNYKHRDKTRFLTPLAIGAGACYDIFGDQNKTADPLGESETTYVFGAFRGSLWRKDATSVVIEIGSRDDLESSLGGDSYNQYSVDKVGTNVLEVTMNRLAAVRVHDGILDIGKLPTSYVSFLGGSLRCEEGVDPSAIIKNSSAPIVFDDEGRDTVWTNALAASNTGGFVKCGAGTMAMEEIPLLGGSIEVREGILILPQALATNYDFRARIAVASGAQARFTKPMPTSAVCWREAKTIAGAGDVNTEGTTVYAYHHRYGAKTQTVDGVPFEVMYRVNDSFPVAYAPYNKSYFGGAEANTNGLEGVEMSAGWRNALVGHYRTDKAQTVTLGGLVPYRRYAVQLFAQCSSATNGDDVVLLDGTAALSCNTGGAEPGPGQHITGDFITESDTMSFTVTPQSESGYVHISAIQVRELSETYRWDGSGDGMTWDGTGYNWEGLSPDLEYWLAPEGYGRTAIIDRDAEIGVCAELVANLVISNAAVSMFPVEGGCVTSADGLRLAVTEGELEIDIAEAVETHSAVLDMTPHTASKALAAVDCSNSVFVAMYDALDYTRFEGAAKFRSDEAQTVCVPEGATNTFYGTMSGEMSFAKTGAGVMRLEGPNDFTGGLAVYEGTLALCNRLDDLAIEYGFDATRTNGWEIADDGSVTAFAYSGADGQVRSKTTLVATNGSARITTTAQGGAFAGMPSLEFDGDEIFNVHYTTGKSFVFVAKADETGSDLVRCTEKDRLSLGEAWSLTVNNVNQDWAVMVDGGKDLASTTNNAQIVSAVARPAANDRRTDSVGNGFKGRIAEFVALSEKASFEDRRAVEAYMANKWALDSVGRFAMLPRRGTLTVAAGATLDLGGLSQTVESLVLGGTVTNGTLEVTGDATFLPGATVYVGSANRGDTVMKVGGTVSGIGSLTAKLSDGSELDRSLITGVADEGVAIVAKPVYAIVCQYDAHIPYLADYLVRNQAAHPEYFCIATNKTFVAADGDMTFDITNMKLVNLTNYLAKVETVLDENWQARHAYSLYGKSVDRFESIFLAENAPGRSVGSVYATTSKPSALSGTWMRAIDAGGSVKSANGLTAELWTSGNRTSYYKGFVKAATVLRICDMSGNLIWGDPLLDLCALTDEERRISIGEDETFSGAIATVSAFAESSSAISGDGSASLRVQHGIEVAGSSLSVGKGVGGGFGGRGVVFTGEAGALTIACDRAFYVAGVTNASSIAIFGSGAVLRWEGIDLETLGSLSVSGFATVATSEKSANAKSVVDAILAVATFADGARMAIAFSDGVTKCIPEDGAPASALATFTVSNADDESAAGRASYEDEHLAAMGSVVRDGGTLTLEGDAAFDGTFVVDADGVVLDLDGYTLSNDGNAATWMFNVGSHGLTVANGEIDCGDGFGFWITDGSLILSNVTVRSEGRCVQIAGAGSLFVDADSILVNTGNDPTLMAVGGYDGRAYAEISGIVRNVGDDVADGEENWRYAISGRDDDMAGADIVINAGAEVSTEAGERVVYHPYTESGMLKNVNVTPVVVDWNWLYKKQIDPEDVGKLGANDIPHWQSYLLGLDPSLPDSKPQIVSISMSDDGTDEEVIVEAANVTPAGDAQATVGYTLEELELDGGNGVRVIGTTDWERGRELMQFPRREGATKQFFRLKTVISY